MTAYKYGTQDPIPEGYQSIRDIITGMGYKPENIGYNAQNKNPMLMGKELDASKLLAGSDQHYYATPDTLNSMISGLGLSAPISTMQTNPQSMPQMQPYQSQFSPQIEALLGQILNRPQFQYNSQTDPGFQQASKDISSKTMLDFARRNMLYSPATGEAVSQGIANAMPGFEQAAYSRYMDEGTVLTNQLNTLMGMDERSYGMYKDKLDFEWKTWEANRQIRQDQLNEQNNLVEKAYKKLDELEYADNEVAAILGIPVGTKSQAAKVRAEEMKNKLELMKKEEEANARQQARSFANEKSLITYRDQLSKEEAARKETETKGTPEQQSYYKEFLNLYTTGANWKEDPLKALQNVLARQTQHEELLGPTLYEKLINTLQALASTNTKVEKTDTSKTLSLSEVNNTVDNMKENGNSTQDIGTFMAKSLLEAGYDEDQVVSQLKSKGIQYDEKTGVFSIIEEE
jgi:hypothetical protein